MNDVAKAITILMADDDEDDRLLAREAFIEGRLRNELRFVEDGEDLMDYLFRRGKYAGTNIPRPDIILLDLNMPRKDGREALKEIKSDPNLRSIPVIVLTTSKSDEDIVKSYDLGVNSFIKKPVKFDSLVDVIRSIGKYWLEIVELPASLKGKI